MITSIRNRTTIGNAMALGFLLATLLSPAPAGAAVLSGKAFSWGYNSDGQLGNSNTGSPSKVPVAVKNLTGVKSVKAGGRHGLALKTDGTVYAWGYNFHGQLGNGTNDSSNVPVRVKINNVKAISAGYDHNLALKEDGSVWAWGYNYSGQLGRGTSGLGTDSNVPVKVASLGTGAKGIAAGIDFSLALMKDGTVRSWGGNSSGQLGDDTKDPRNTPGAVTGLTSVKALAADSTAPHVLALLQDGTVRAWGYNSHGQLGDGTTGTDRTTPVVVKNLSGVAGIATGDEHSLALLGNGTVKSWGDNVFGQLGNATNDSSSTPKVVIGLSNVRSISGGHEHSLAILESGEARSWGSNSSGQLGVGSTVSSINVPVTITKLANVRSMDGGNDFTLAATG